MKLLKLLGVVFALPSCQGIARSTVDVSSVGYYVLFSDETSGAGASRCGGILIKPDTVLTTARCAALALPYARVGYTSDSSSTGVSTIKRFANNPGFSPNHQTLVNDIAIVVLDTTFEGITSPILDRIPYNVNDNGLELTVLGAGDTSEGGSFATSLRGETVFTEDFIQCRNDYNGNDPRVHLREYSHFCAGFDGVAAGPCSNGDIGSPILAFTGSDASDTIVGLASFGDPGCGVQDKSFIYTRMARFVNWIDAALCTYSAYANSCPTPKPTPKPTASPTAKPTDPALNFFTLITRTDEGAGGSRCGASLIWKDIVVTASFCLSPGRVVRVGYTSDEVEAEVRRIEALVDHPGAFGVRENFPNDISVGKLDEPVHDVTPIAINNISAIPPDNGATVYYAHAGTLEDVTDPFVLGRFQIADMWATEIQTGSTTTAQFRFCTDDWHSKYPFYSSRLEENKQFCANSSPGVGPCDSGAWGSPLWVFRNGSPLLVGIASQGSCKAENPPFIYTRVAFYSAWIWEQICCLSDYPPARCVCPDDSS